HRSSPFGISFRPFVRARRPSGGPLWVSGGIGRTKRGPERVSRGRIRVNGGTRRNSLGTVRPSGGRDGRSGGPFHPSGGPESPNGGLDRNFRGQGQKEVPPDAQNEATALPSGPTGREILVVCQRRIV